MKRRIFALAVIAICLSLAAWGTYAFFTVEEVTHNIITTGGVDIAIEEWRDTDDGRIPFPQNAAILIMPGSVESKIVTVHNLDGNTYVRLKYDYTVYNAAGELMTITPDVLNEIIHIEPNTEDWEKVGEWYYYKKAMVVDEITEPLFTEVSFPAEKLGNEYQKAKLIINVTAHAVQAANNGDVPSEADGWPK